MKKLLLLQEPVEKVAPCSHKQTTACSAPARKAQCITLVKAPTAGLSTCGHYTMVPCGLRDTSKCIID